MYVQMIQAAVTPSISYNAAIGHQLHDVTHLHSGMSRDLSLLIKCAIRPSYVCCLLIGPFINLMTDFSAIFGIGRPLENRKNQLGFFSGGGG